MVEIDAQRWSNGASGVVGSGGVEGGGRAACDIFVGKDEKHTGVRAIRQARTMHSNDPTNKARPLARK